MENGTFRYGTIDLENGLKTGFKFMHVCHLRKHMPQPAIYERVCCSIPRVSDQGPSLLLACLRKYIEEGTQEDRLKLAYPYFFSSIFKPNTQLLS